MKSMITASALLLLAGLGLAPPAIAQTTDPLSPQPAISRPTTQPYGVLYSRQQAKLPPGRTLASPADPPGTGLNFDPYPSGYGLYSGGN
jgi:hypothetical protein